MKPSAGALTGGEGFRDVALLLAAIFLVVYFAVVGVPEVLLP